DRPRRLPVMPVPATESAQVREGEQAPPARARARSGGARSVRAREGRARGPRGLVPWRALAARPLGGPEPTPPGHAPDAAEALQQGEDRRLAPPRAHRLP